MKSVKVNRATLALLGLVILGMLVGWGKLQWFSQPKSLVLNTAEVLPLEYYVESKSFSEIENTRALLQGLAVQFISDIRGRFAEVAYAQSHNRANVVRDALQEVESKKVEFKGTDQELLLVEEQLMLLHQAKLFEQWLDVYLKALYERPTHSLVGNHAERALALGKETGRETEVLAGFQHLSRIPAQFHSKARIQSLLPQQELASHLAKPHEDNLL